MAIIFGLIAVSCYQRFFSDGKSEIEARLFRDKLARELVKTAEFSELYRDEKSIVLEKRTVNAVPAAQVFARRILTGLDSVEVQIIAINNGVFFEKSKDHYVKSVGQSLEKIELGGILALLRIQGTFDSSREFLCLGLASHNPNSMGNDLSLTKRRAEKISSDLSLTLDAPVSRIRAVALGSAETLSSAPETQRSALILGIDGGPYFQVEQNLTYILKTASVPGVSLADYRYSNKPVHGQFRSDAEIQWSDKDVAVSVLTLEAITPQTP